MDELSYTAKQESDLAAYEAMCRRCGECCGARGKDPCANLEILADSTYNCAVYDNRLGPQKTVSGRIFSCVTIHDVRKFGVTYGGCPCTR